MPDAPKPKTPIASWDELAGEEKPAGMSADMARKLLEMNPALRNQGLSTDVIVNRAPQPGGPKPQAQKAQGFLELVALTVDGVTAEHRKIDEEIAALQRRKLAARDEAQQAIIKWLLGNDPDMLSPVTQRVIEQHKAVLEKIGFTVQGYLAERGKRMKPAPR